MTERMYFENKNKKEHVAFFEKESTCTICNSAKT